MSLVMVHERKRPVVRVGRFAGQYAKPRSKPVEAREGVVRPSYFGDMINSADFTEDGRRPDPENMIAAYSCPCGAARPPWCSCRCLARLARGAPHLAEALGQVEGDLAVDLRAPAGRERGGHDEA
jgi:hypothetical protein